MAVAHVFLQVIFSLEDLLLVAKRSDGARVTFVLMRGAMSKEGVSTCICSSAEWFRAPPRLMLDSFGVSVQFLKVSEQLVALLANMALLIVLV